MPACTQGQNQPLPEISMPSFGAVAAPGRRNSPKGAQGVCRKPPTPRHPLARCFPSGSCSTLLPSPFPGEAGPWVPAMPKSPSAQGPPKLYPGDFFGPLPKARREGKSGAGWAQPDAPRQVQPRCPVPASQPATHPLPAPPAARGDAAGAGPGPGAGAAVPGPGSPTDRRLLRCSRGPLFAARGCPGTGVGSAPASPPRGLQLSLGRAGHAPPPGLLSSSPPPAAPCTQGPFPSPEPVSVGLDRQGGCSPTPTPLPAL